MSRARDYAFSRCFRGLHLITLSLVGVLILVGCQDSSSRAGSAPAGSGDGSSTQKSSGDVEASQTTYYDHSESFVAEALKVKTLGKPLHMLWVVDTTGKSINSPPLLARIKHGDSNKNMADEIAAINKHLPLLINSFKELSTVQTTIAFTSDSRRGIGSSINMKVMESHGVHREGLDINGHGGDFLRETKFYLVEYLEKRHPSRDFFRDPKALNVMVFVRDRGIPAGGVNYASHNSGEKGIPHSQRFISDVGGKIGASSLRAFALIDLRDPFLNNSCDKSDIWSACNYSYTHIVESFGGEKYHTNNISPSEWTKVFSQLKNKMIEEMGGDSAEKKQKVTFTLERPASKILEVKVEGQALPETSVQVTGKTLYIDAEHVSEGQNIVVKYQSTQSS